jgi:hypothetical protein
MRHLLSRNHRYNSLQPENMIPRMSSLVNGSIGPGFMLCDEYLTWKQNIIARVALQSKVLLAIFKR